MWVEVVPVPIWSSFIEKVYRRGVFCLHWVAGRMDLWSQFPLELFLVHRVVGVAKAVGFDERNSTTLMMRLNFAPASAILGTDTHRVNRTMHLHYGIFSIGTISKDFERLIYFLPPFVSDLFSCFHTVWILFVLFSFNKRILQLCGKSS